MHGIHFSQSKYVKIIYFILHVICTTILIYKNSNLQVQFDNVLFCPIALIHNKKIF